MENDALFAEIPPDLFPTFEDLRRREPIFHTPEFGTTLSEFERIMAPAYWEVGASGNRYSRGFILRHLARNPPADAATSGWNCCDFGLRELGPNTYLFTYTLHQAERRSRRATIWRHTSDGWQILYHQGTQVAVEETVSRNQPEPDKPT